MKLFAQDTKFAEAGRDPAALEKLLAWHLRQRKWFVALLLFYICAGVAVVVAGTLYIMQVLRFLRGEGGKMPEPPAGLSASVINSFSIAFISLVAGTGAAFMHNEVCIKMLLLHRSAHPPAPGDEETPAKP